MIWAIVRSVLFDILCKKGYGIKIRGSVSARKLNLTGFGFFGDIDIVETGTNVYDVYEIVQRLQESIDW